MLRSSIEETMDIRNDTTHVQRTVDSIQPQRRIPTECSGKRLTRLLFVGGETRAKRWVCSRLRKFGFEIVTQSDGPTAVLHAIDQPPDLIVMNHPAQRIDLLDLLARFMHAASTAGVPLLFLMEQTDEDLERSCRRLGITLLVGGMEKSFSPPRLRIADTSRSICYRSSGKQSATKTNFNESLSGDLGRVSSPVAEAPQPAGRSASPRRYGPIPLDGEIC